jgi:hypothetical protein
VSHAARGATVTDLILKRRRIALLYQRSQSDSDRHQLEIIDQQLAGYHIDIPAIQRSLARVGKPQTGKSRG